MKKTKNVFLTLLALMIALVFCLAACGEPESPIGTADVESIVITNTQTSFAPGDHVITAKCLPVNSPQEYTIVLKGAPKGVSLTSKDVDGKKVYTLTVSSNAINSSEIELTAVSDDDKTISIKKKFSLAIPEPTYVMISTEQQLRDIANNMSGNYKLANDIELTEDWVQLGDAQQEPDGAPIQEAKNPFKGIFDGNGYAVKNVKMNDTDKVTGYSRGFFGRIDAAGTVRNASFEGGKMYFRGWSGVVAAQNFGVISNVFTNVEIHTLGGVSAALVVTNGGLIENCYAIGKTTCESTDSNQAGFFGATDGGSQIGCYIDRESSTVIAFAGGRWESGNEAWNMEFLRSTEQMKTAATFTNANWDTKYWQLVDGQYPKLKHN